MTVENDDILIAGLYVVATPIGNLGDFSLRAVRTLKDVDVIACEDTRTSRVLLNRYQINTKLISYHDHNADKAIPGILESIKSGKKVALISDAGSPLVSDPGYRLVSACRSEGLYVTAVPGASAVITALQLSALSPQSFVFKGFLPHKDGERRKIFEKMKIYDDITAVFYETAHRIMASLAAVRDVFGEIRVCVARELTKKFEEVTTGPVSEIIAHYEGKDVIRGEIVLLLELVKEREEITPARIIRELEDAMLTMDKKSAVAFVAKALDIRKTAVYDIAVKMLNTNPTNH